ncbi:PACE efflux transporter, partial [Pseudoalteromonas distincta]|uniref:PACE efflux transporter n=1 Tax=Pseudoalteromonas distincta TaxID=77608 RepID=UPI0039ECBB54
GALSGTMIIIATIAMCWNFIFNWCFDKVATGAKEQRSVLFRIFHVLLFQGGLLVFTIPVMAIILKVGLWEALIMDIGVTFFITLYAFTFNLVYDHTRAYIFHSKNAAC